MRIATQVVVGLAVVASAMTALAGPPNPQKIVAFIDGTQSFGSTRRAVSFYDVTDVGTTSTADVFNQTPLFSIWPGYEDTLGTNFEDPSSIAVNPANGDVYLLAFDSPDVTATGVVDSVGDTQGDYDLYVLDFQAALDDFMTNNRAPGVMYAPVTATDGLAAGDHPDNIGNTINLSGVSNKVGEIGRTQGSAFFDPDLVFFDPATLALVDDESDNSLDDISVDHELRTIDRVATTSGSATIDAANSTTGSVVGGYNAQTSESWESNRVGVINMDFVGGVPTGRSEPEDIAGVETAAVNGVWIAETDGGGDDLSFFPLPSTPSSVAPGTPATTTTIDALGNSRSLDEDPELDPTTNDGSHDTIQLDVDGNLVIVESGFFDALPGGEAGLGGSPAGEPSVIRLNVDSYSSTDVDLNADVWDDLDEVDGLGPVGTDRVGDDLDRPTQLEGPFGSLTNTFAGGTGLSADDDTAVTDGRFTTFDPGTGYLYIFDIDSGGLPGVVADAIVVDTTTGEIVYEEANAANHFLIEHGIRFFLRGDLDGDGDVDDADIDALTAAGRGSDALLKEEFDLTSDDDVTNGTTSTTDLAAMVEGVLGTAFGDANLDGNVNSADFSILSANFGGAGGWANGDFTGDGMVNSADFSVLSANFGFTNMPPAVAVPEASSLVMLLASAIGLSVTRRDRC